MSAKYNNKRGTLDGYSFDSQAEMRRYQELCLLVKAGEIMDLKVHPSLPLYAVDCRDVFATDRIVVARYEADFSYRVVGQAHEGSTTATAGGYAVYEDVKGVRTALFRLKARWVKACYGIEIVEVEA